MTPEEATARLDVIRQESETRSVERRAAADARAALLLASRTPTEWTEFTWTLPGSRWTLNVSDVGIHLYNQFIWFGELDRVELEQKQWGAGEVLSARFFNAANQEFAPLQEFGVENREIAERFQAKVHEALAAWRARYPTLP